MASIRQRDSALQVCKAPLVEAGLCICDSAAAAVSRKMLAAVLSPMENASLYSACMRVTTSSPQSQMNLTQCVLCMVS